MSEHLTKPLIVSIVGLLMNKVKLSMRSAKKNKLLADKLETTIALLSEQLLPHFIQQNMNNYDELNNMHNLCYLFSHKTQQVFNSRIIHTCIDQNWDLKGFKQVLVRIFKAIQLPNIEEITGLLDF